MYWYVSPALSRRPPRRLSASRAAQHGIKSSNSWLKPITRIWSCGRNCLAMFISSINALLMRLSDSPASREDILPLQSSRKMTSKGCSTSSNSHVVVVIVVELELLEEARGFRGVFFMVGVVDMGWTRFPSSLLLLLLLLLLLSLSFTDHEDPYAGFLTVLLNPQKTPRSMPFPSHPLTSTVNCRPNECIHMYISVYMCGAHAYTYCMGTESDTT